MGDGRGQRQLVRPDHRGQHDHRPDACQRRRVPAEQQHFGAGAALAAAVPIHFSLPNGAAGVGQLSITVTADAGGSLLDYDPNGTIDTNRSATLTVQTTLGAYPDLHAAGLAVDASSGLQAGGTVTLDWNDSNVGTAAASGSWYDQVTVVNTTTGQTLANADSVSRQQHFGAGRRSCRGPL